MWGLQTLHTHVCTCRAQMPSRSALEARPQPGERGLPGAAHSLPGTGSAASSKQRPVCPGTEPLAVRRQRAALTNIEPGIINPRCGLGK